MAHRYHLLVSLILSRIVARKGHGGLVLNLVDPFVPSTRYHQSCVQHNLEPICRDIGTFRMRKVRVLASGLTFQTNTGHTPRIAGYHEEAHFLGRTARILPLTYTQALNRYHQPAPSKVFRLRVVVLSLSFCVHLSRHCVPPTYNSASPSLNS